MPAIALKKWWVLIHRWIGVIGLVAMIVLAITGSALVWPDSTEKLFHSNRFVATNSFDESRLDEYTEAAIGALPEGDRISAMSIPPNGSDRSILTGGAPHASGRVGPPPRHRAWVDPGTGEATARWGLAPDTMWYMHALHGHFAWPHYGRPLVGIFGFLLLLSAISGVWIWWPKNGKILKAMRWRRAPDFLSNLHHMVGFWSALPMAVLGFTGAYIVFPAMFGTLVLFFSGNLGSETGGRDHEVAPPIVAPAAETLLKPTEVVEIARKTGATGALTFLSWPSEEGASWMTRFDCESSAAKCISAVIINDTDGSAIEPQEEHEESIASDAADLMFAIHAGSVGGPVWQILVFLAGIILTLLSITGVIMWAQKRGARIRMKKLKSQSN